MKFLFKSKYTNIGKKTASYSYMNPRKFSSV
jgi:hypothetical protein